jgi:hypothetical protein
VKIKAQGHSILGIALALFVMALMSFQSAHRCLEHHDAEEEEHEECGLCQWDFAPVETIGFVFYVSAHFTPEMSHFASVVLDEVQNAHASFDGRGPPAA